MDRNTYIMYFDGGKPPSKVQSHMTLFSWGQPHFSSNFAKIFGKILKENEVGPMKQA